MRMQDIPYFKQARLMLRVLPHVAAEEGFALKGGSAINFFVREMPRLSVDIDLVWLPLSPRDTALADIGRTLEGIAARIRKAMPDATVQESRPGGMAHVSKLLVRSAEATIKIEPNLIIRGVVHPAEERGLCAAAESLFELTVSMRTAAFPDLYAGKLCAALDRQHPRDLFDVHLLMEHEGISEQLKDTFLVYLLSHNRPMAELLDPMMQDIKPAYRREFEGMVLEPVSLDALIETRSRLIRALRGRLTEADKRFLVAVKRGNADWGQFVFPEASRMPAIQWKLHNLQRMTQKKRRESTEKLEAALFG